MKKASANKDSMRREYDFSKGVRGKHEGKFKKDLTTIVHNEDGSKTVTRTRLIALEPDVQKYFPNSKSANRALRGLIALLPQDSR